MSPAHGIGWTPADSVEIGSFVETFDGRVFRIEEVAEGSAAKIIVGREIIGPDCRGRVVRVFETSIFRTGFLSWGSCLATETFPGYEILYSGGRRGTVVDHVYEAEALVVFDPEADAEAVVPYRSVERITSTEVVCAGCGKPPRGPIVFVRRGAVTCAECNEETSEG